MQFQNVTTKNVLCQIHTSNDKNQAEVYSGAEFLCTIQAEVTSVKFLTVNN